MKRCGEDRWFEGGILHESDRGFVWKRTQGFPSENNHRTNSENLSKTGEESPGTRSKCNVGKEFFQEAEKKPRVLQ